MNNLKPTAQWLHWLSLFANTAAFRLLSCSQVFLWTASTPKGPSQPSRQKNNFSCNICLSNKLLVYDVCVVEAVWCNISGFIFLGKIFRFKFLCVYIEGFVNSFLCQGVPACCETKQVYQPQSTLRFVTYNCDVGLGFRDPASSFFEIAPGLNLMGLSRLT